MARKADEPAKLSGLLLCRGSSVASFLLCFFFFSLFFLSVFFFFFKQPPLLSSACVLLKSSPTLSSFRLKRMQLDYAPLTFQRLR